MDKIKNIFANFSLFNKLFQLIFFQYFYRSYSHTIFFYQIEFDSSSSGFFFGEIYIVLLFYFNEFIEKYILILEKL